ncbi:hypothetical protein B0H34DRAFT_197718 [Crassisporium funariophilum]|nr:hypothetical protein B0H34DRAFT_197718 [Crassisporium funariophilum]
MRIQQILLALLVSGASIATAMPMYNPEARGLSVSARDIDLINELVAIAVREVLESRGSGSSKVDKKGKGKKGGSPPAYENPPSYNRVGHDRPPPFYQGNHPGIPNVRDPHQPNYANNHKSPSHNGGR